MGLAASVAFSTSISLADELPSPVVLVRAVESMRLQIPPSTLLLRVVVSSQSTEPYVRELRVLFDGDRTRFQVDYSSIEETPQPIRCLFNGEYIIHYDGKTDVTFRDSGDATGDLLFDPRLLGISTRLLLGETVSSALPYRDAHTVELMGREAISGVSTWRVRLSDRAGGIVEVWIDPTANFQVLRYEVVSPDGMSATTRSYYDASVYPWLPTRSVTRVDYGPGKSGYEVEMLLLEGTSHVSIGPETWTIAGLSPPVGATIEDRRIREILGHWDGTRLRPYHGDLAEPSANPWARYTFLGLVVLMTGVLFWLFRSRRRVA